MQKRNLGIDALKIVSMLMIVSLHVLGQGGILANLPVFSMRYNMSWFIEMLSLCSVNCFALATGYVNVNKKYNFKSIIYLWLEVIFYSVTLIGIVWIFKPDRINAYYLPKMFLPTFSHSYWYFTAYAGLYLFIPLLNAIIKHVDRKIFSRSMFLIITLTSISSLFNSNFIWEQSGYSTIWLMLMYLTGGYVREHKLRSSMGKRNLFLFFYLCLLNFLIKLGVEYFFPNAVYISRLTYTLTYYTSPFLIVASLNLFLFFEQYQPNERMAKKILLLESLTFGVYLIHVNPAIWEVVLKDSFIFNTNFVSVLYFFILGIGILGVYGICSFIDYFRMKLFNLLQLKRVAESADKMINGLIN